MFIGLGVLAGLIAGLLVSWRMKSKWSLSCIVGVIVALITLFIVLSVVMPAFWPVFIGTVCGAVYHKGKGDDSVIVGIAAGAIVFVLLALSMPLLPSIMEERADATDLLLQNGTCVFGSASMGESRDIDGNKIIGRNYYYSYWANTSNGGKLEVIDGNTGIEPSVEKGTIVTYRKYKVYLGGWHWDFFYAGNIRETLEKNSRTVIYVPNGTVKMTDEFMFWKGIKHPS